jgi:hypothetical protein
VKSTVLVLVVASSLYVASAQPEVNQTFDPSQGLNENRAVCGDEVCRPIERGVCPTDCAQDSGNTGDEKGEDRTKQPSIADNRAEIESGGEPPAQDVQEANPQSEASPADTRGSEVSGSTTQSVASYVDDNPIISGIAGAFMIFAVSVLVAALRDSAFAVKNTET